MRRLREALTHEHKAHQSETEEKLKAQREIERLKSETKPKENPASNPFEGMEGMMRRLFGPNP